MSQILVVNYGEQEFTSFDTAVNHLKNEYGFYGLVWNMVEDSNDFEVLCEFLNDKGIDAEVV